jgi:phage-related minor tail protein
MTPEEQRRGFQDAAGDRVMAIFAKFNKGTDDAGAAATLTLALEVHDLKTALARIETKISTLESTTRAIANRS